MKPQASENSPLDRSIATAISEFRQQHLFQTIVHTRQAGSTNDDAIRFARRAILDQTFSLLPALWVSDTQIAGRGRGGRVFNADGGTLTFSMLLRSQSPTRTAALMVCCRRIVPRIEACF